MHILFLTPQLPYPPHQGASLRNFHILKHLARGHTLYLATFFSPDQAPDQIGPLGDLCAKLILLPEPNRTTGERMRDTLTSGMPDMAHRLEHPAMHRAIRQLMAEQPVDLVQIEGIEMAQYGLSAAQAVGERAPWLLLDNHNAEYLLQKRSALMDLGRWRRWPAALYSLLQWQKLVRYEREICQGVDGVVAVSPADQAALTQLVPRLRSTVVANGIDLAQFPPAEPRAPQADPPTLVFTGKMDYRPNIDAVLWFGEKVLPLILQRYPTVRFQIVGRTPHPRLDPLRAHPNIEITGAVPDVQPYIRQAQLYVAPLRVGGGTRFKILEAMACSSALVSTHLGVEGIPIYSGQEALLADSPQEFAVAVCSLLDPQSGPARRQKLGRVARNFVAQHYSWEQILPGLEQFLQDLVSSE